MPYPNSRSTDRLGAAISRQELLAWAEQGQYFRAVNGTLGTGIAAAITTSFSATAALLAMVNGSSAGVWVIPHYIRLICTAAGASSTSSRLAVALDTANRYSSGGTDLTTQIVNSNSALSPASVVTPLRAGAVVAAAAVAARYVANMGLKTQASPCWTVGDEVTLNFLPSSSAGGIPISGSAAQQIIKDIGPVILGGQNHSLLLHMWNPANATTPPSWELELAWWERPAP